MRYGLLVKDGSRKIRGNVCKTYFYYFSVTLFVSIVCLPLPFMSNVFFSCFPFVPFFVLFSLKFCLFLFHHGPFFFPISFIVPCVHLLTLRTLSLALFSGSFAFPFLFHLFSVVPYCFLCFLFLLFFSILLVSTVILCSFIILYPLFFILNEWRF